MALVTLYVDGGYDGWHGPTVILFIPLYAHACDGSLARAICE